MIRNALFALATMLILSGCEPEGTLLTPPVEDEQSMRLGLLQFHVQHNLLDDTCIDSGDCNFATEEVDDPDGWLAQISEVSDLAVLHWDRAIPWLVFDESPPGEDDRVAHYDERIDADLRRWLDAFEAHFAASERGYLAVSALGGVRDELAWWRLGEQDEIPVGEVCPDLSPGAEVELDDGQHSGTVDVQRAYLNFLLYLVDKLQPDDIGLMIEFNMFGDACPAQWDGAVELYHALYDDVRAHVGPNPRIFATLTYEDLLGYDAEQCWGDLAFQECGVAGTPPAYPEPDPEHCFPLDLYAIGDLDQGDRLDVLALSFYPDSMLVTPPGLVPPDLELFLGDADASDPCSMRAEYYPWLDPMAQLPRLGWDKPFAWAETSARSCGTPLWIELEPPNFAVLGDTLETQAFWLEHSLATAEEHGFSFAVQSFHRDYDPLGLWLMQGEQMDTWSFNAVNAWPCSGLYTVDGEPKPGVTDLWLDAVP